MGNWTTTPKTWAVGDKATAALLNQQLRDFANGFGAFTSWTPTLAQGVSTNISKTVNYAKYLRVQKLVIAQVSLTATGTGTAGSAITITLPVTAAAAPSHLMIGVGTYYDVGTATYGALVSIASTTTAQLVRTEVATAAVVGATPSFAVAANDAWAGTFLYEAA